MECPCAVVVLARIFWNENLSLWFMPSQISRRNCRPITFFTILLILRRIPNSLKKISWIYNGEKSFKNVSFKRFFFAKVLIFGRIWRKNEIVMKIRMRHFWWFSNYLRPSFFNERCKNLFLCHLKKQYAKCHENDFLLNVY